MNGVLSIPASATQKPSTAAYQKNMTPKAAAPRLKLVLRRLPPGLTQDEFEAALGNEWKVGGGRVDWYLYKEGKISKE
jgi:regulator of nonsense transcripts 3